MPHATAKSAKIIPIKQGSPPPVKWHMVQEGEQITELFFLVDVQTGRPSFFFYTDLEARQQKIAGEVVVPVSVTRR